MWILWCLILACWWIWSKWRYLITYWKVGAKYPALPILGHAYLLSNREIMLRRLFSMGDHAISNGGLSAVWFLDRFYITLADAVDAEYILKNHLEKCDLLSILRLFTRSAFLFTPVIQWRPRRRIVSSLFSHKNVSKFEPVFSRGSETLVQQLQPRAGQGPFSIWKYFSEFSVEATCGTILGIELKEQSTKQNLKNALNGIVELGAVFLVFHCLHLGWLAKRTGLYSMFRKHDEVVKRCVDEALEKHIKDTPTNSASYTDDDDQDSSLLHMFVRLKQQREVDRSMLHDESLGQLIASSDSTAVSSSLLAVMLAGKPKVQDMVYQELRDVFGDSDRPVELDDLPRLKYMEATIKEILRLFPTIPHITRKVVVDTTLPSGVTVPKGTSFLVSIYALNRNPKYWGADADRFRPERFLDGSVPEQATNFTFSHGPRNCPGSQYAMLSMKTVLATLLRRYRLLPAAGDAPAPLRLQFGATVRAADHFQVRIETRK